MDKNTKSKTNIEKVTEYMEFGSPMNQMFLMAAVTKYADEIIQNEKEVIAEFKDSMISGPAWIEAAKNWQKANKE